MKTSLLALSCIFAVHLQALEYELQLDNEYVTVCKVKIAPHEEIGLHRDTHRQVVFAIQGGIITRLEANGSTTDVLFPTAHAVFRNIDPENEMHKSVNQSDEPIELLIIQLKDTPLKPTP